MSAVLISACLLGVCCRYDGESHPCEVLKDLPESLHLIPVCPEQLGGLPTPRTPAERRGHAVITREGSDVTEAYRAGALEVLRLARRFDCHAAILKERSPSCGCGEIYDGSFTHTLIHGDGVTAELLKSFGFRIYGESRIHELLSDAEPKK